MSKKPELEPISVAERQLTEKLLQGVEQWSSRLLECSNGDLQKMGSFLEGVCSRLRKISQAPRLEDYEGG